MNIVIIGNGGHSKVIKEMVLNNNDFELLAQLDDMYDDIFSENKILYGPISYYKHLINIYKELKFVIAIGNNETRKKVFLNLCLPSDFYATVIHPSATVSKSATLGAGTVVMAQAVLNAESIIGEQVIINTGAIVEHDNQIKNFSHTSPRSTLTGNVYVGEGVHIGAGATILPNVKIGDWSIVGAGATVTKDIPACKTAVGIPARF
ncbi:acetyltransferase [Metabacillus sp. cB07]|uniref:acetyltransferase n=1 Tax=Metabacillus sp. cB07 TaxID=2806989 RepID=UPI00193A5D5C|nr:acetyltransferase [Metabacillus sp. cB07]